MKKIMLLTIALFTAPLVSSPNCMENSKHFIQCNCSCNIVRNAYCTECMHLQRAQPYTILTPTEMSKKNTQQSTKDISRDPQDVLNKLAVRYLQNK